MPLSRRQILQASLLGGLAGTFGAIAPASNLRSLGAPGPSTFAGGALDGFELLRRAVRQGQRIQLGGSVAHAAPEDEMVIVTIKIMNLIHSPLCFKLGALNAGEDDVLPYTGPTAPNVALSAKFSNVNSFNLLTARGVDKPSDIPRFKSLRMNKWFASILNTGMDETNGVPNVLTAADIGPFPGADDVAVQAALGVSQTNLSLNHSFENCSLPRSTDAAKGGDIGYHCARQNLVTSPLGLVCFNMGVIVETTDAIGNVPNRVVGNDLRTVVALGRSVDSYVTVLRQAVGLGLIDEDLVAKFDALVKADPTLANELKKNRATLQAALAAMGSASAIEGRNHEMPGVNGAANLQAIGSAANQTAKSEFLAQCKFVQRALEVPGKPFRNFTLMINVMDLDGLPLDVAPINNGVGAANACSYVEGMRQLAIGLNMLAHVIKRHRNVYVVVVSEGGRSAERGDSKASQILLMGPGGTGRLKDHLYADMAAVNSQADPFRADPNSGNVGMTGTGQRMPSGNVVANEAGATIAEHMTTGAFLTGLVRHLEQVRSVAPTTAGLGKFVRIQTK